eukprot:3071695-Alexandrium_andersonii.AAC.1
MPGGAADTRRQHAEAQLANVLQTLASDVAQLRSEIAAMRAPPPVAATSPFHPPAPAASAASVQPAASSPFQPALQP